METIGHLPFIVGSYAAALVIIGGLVAWIAVDFRAQRRALGDLELRGMKRRSASPTQHRPMEEAKEKA